MRGTERMDQALINSGDHARLRRVMEKAERGEALCIAFLGGSITEGYSSTAHENCYAARIFSWWEKSFPQSRMRYVNAGIGGTGSDYGAARAERDVLSERPDVVFVDFSVNDAANEFYQECYEGLLRKLLGSTGQPAVVLLHFIKYDDGTTAEAEHLALGRHYGLPCLSVRSSIYAMIKSGELEAESITADGLHPNDKGHGMIAELVTAFLEEVRKENAAGAEAALPEALTANAWEAVTLWQNGNSAPELSGFSADKKEKEYPADHFRGGWTGKKAGDEIRFRFYGSELAVQFRRTVKRPAPVAAAVVDGDERRPVFLDANFDQDWGDCLSTVPVMRHGQLLDGLTPERRSPLRYDTYNEVIRLAGEKPVQAAEHTLCIRVLGEPEELGWEKAALNTGEVAWLKSEEGSGETAFDLLGILVSAAEKKGETA
ncbi:MAG: SGNH/GDSL hydrolase family protein [Lachnospiraceae bacterium]|nr:SGNH/GDSL hydrolase family protein [Lachnospiraceae bacterium]